ncbi:MAG: hypothetical protein DWQ07_17705 [Chloroflexi bacterium]|nr:MAG: hypothetical protein DWQ07_17705 [Chloroflexota bacterium]
MVLTFQRQHLPTPVQDSVLNLAADQSYPLKRRLILIGLLWRERGLHKYALIARVEAILGTGCFGKQATLTFARDIQFVRETFSQAGYALQYRRKKGHTGYAVLERPQIDEHIEKKIAAAVSEVSPEQAVVQARLSPAERVWQGASLSDLLLQQAVRLHLKSNPDLDTRSAQREVLRRMYLLEV